MRRDLVNGTVASHAGDAKAPVLLHQPRYGNDHVRPVSVHCQPGLRRGHGSEAVRDAHHAPFECFHRARSRRTLRVLAQGTDRINESEADRAATVSALGFQRPNSITREPISAMGDRSPMQWFWE